MEIHIDNKEKFVLARIKGIEESEEFVKLAGEITHADEKQHKQKLDWKKIEIYLDKGEFSKIKELK